MDKSAYIPVCIFLWFLWACISLNFFFLVLLTDVSFKFHWNLFHTNIFAALWSRALHAWQRYYTWWHVSVTNVNKNINLIEKRHTGEVKYLYLDIVAARVFRNIQQLFKYRFSQCGEKDTRIYLFNIYVFTHVLSIDFEKLERLDKYPHCARARLSSMMRKLYLHAIFITTLKCMYVHVIY